MAIERLTVELRQRIDLVDAGVDAIADRNVDQAVVAAQGHGRLGTGEGEGLQTGAGAAAEDDGQNTLHAQISRFR